MPSPGYSPTAPGSRPPPRPHSTAADRRPHHAHPSASAPRVSGQSRASAMKARLRLNSYANWAGQVDAFTHRIKQGDLVALPLKTAPAVAFGRVSADYCYDPKAPGPVTHQRPVQWIREDVPRSLIDQDLLFSLGAAMTVCQIRRNNAEQRIEALLQTFN